MRKTLKAKDKIKLIYKVLPKMENAIFNKNTIFLEDTRPNEKIQVIFNVCKGSILFTYRHFLDDKHKEIGHFCVSSPSFKNQKMVSDICDDLDSLEHECYIGLCQNDIW